MPQITLDENNRQQTPIIKLVLASDEKAQDSVSKTFTQASLNELTFMNLGNFNFVNSVPYEGLSALFKILCVKVPINKVIYPPAITNTKDPIVMLGAPKLRKREVAISDSEPVFTADIKNLDGKIMQDGISVGGAILIGTRLPILIESPYFSLDLGLNDLDFGKIEISGLGIKNSTQIIQLDSKLTFSTESSASEALRVLLKEIEDHKIDTPISIKRFSFGPSAANRYVLFDKLNLLLPQKVASGLPALLSKKKALPANDSEIISPDNPSMFQFKFDGKAFSEIKPPTIKLQSMAVSTSGRSILVDADVLVTNDLPITLDVSYIKVSVDAKNQPLMDMELDGTRLLKGKYVVPLKLKVSLTNCLLINL